MLWRKLPGSRSAGRVQSVALRLICEREAEIEVFKPREYWTVEAVFRHRRQARRFTARLTHLDGKQARQVRPRRPRSAAEAAAERDDRAPRLRRGHRSSASQVRRNPLAALHTSTLQQEASRKLGFGASRTMRIAQRLYEGVDIGGETVGLITYMRTDGVQLAAEAIGQARRADRDAVTARTTCPRRRASTRPRPRTPRRRTRRSARPTCSAGRRTSPRYLDNDQLRLYELIWKRTVASQMESAVLDQVAVDIASADGKTVSCAPPARS